MNFYVFSPEQLDGDMSKQVLLEKAAVASVLNKSLVDSSISDFELKYLNNFYLYDNLYQHHHGSYPALSSSLSSEYKSAPSPDHH